MGKGGNKTQTTTVELPRELKEAAIQHLDIGNEVASIGMPQYQGPSIAGFSPQQMAGMQGIDQSAAAFGMPSAVNWQQQSAQQGGGMQAPQGMDSAALFQALTGMQQPQDQIGGFQGYSLQPLLEQALQRTPAAQRAAVESFVMNPHTGAAPTNASVPKPKTKYDSKTGKVTKKKAPAKTAEQIQQDKMQILRDQLMERRHQDRMGGGNR